MKPRSLLTSLTGLTIASALALTGCSAGGAPDADGAENVTSAFLACLASAGMVAKIGDQGLVLVKDTKVSQDDTGDATSIMSVTDEVGIVWTAPVTADYFADDPSAYNIYSSCEEKNTRFSQPDFDPGAFGSNNDDWIAEQSEIALAFAQCARKNGFTQIADPEPTKEAGAVASIIIPDGFTETEFRTLIETCWKPGSSFGIGASKNLEFDPWAVLEDLENAPTQ